MQYMAAYRSVISRAYYAAFNVGIMQLSRWFIFDKAAQDHKKIVFLLKNSGNDNLFIAAENLNTLRKKRNDADYNKICDTFNSIDTAKDNIKTAKDIIGTIESELSGAIESIKEYNLKASVVRARNVCSC